MFEGKGGADRGIGEKPLPEKIYKKNE